MSKDEPTLTFEPFEEEPKKEIDLVEEKTVLTKASCRMRKENN